MGEYLTHSKLGEVKIGTCENLYYTTYQQFNDAVNNGQFEESEASDYLTPDVFRFRFPFPDEKNIEIGDYENFERGVVFKVLKSAKIEISHSTHFHRIENENGALGFELPCIQSDKFPVKSFDWSNTKDFTILEALQQKIAKAGNGIELQTVVRCPYCKSLSRLDKNEAATLLHYTETHPTQFSDLQKEIAAIANDGYKTEIISSIEIGNKILN